MKRHGLRIGAVVIIILASLLFASFRGRPYVQLLFSFKYILYSLAGIVAITLLAAKRVTKPVRLVFLLIFFYIFGVAIGIHPSPLCALTKAPLRYHLSGFIPPPMMVMAAVMLLLTIVGNKIFCGWICPLGCLQEAAFLLSKGISKIKCSFFMTNAVRALLLLLFIILLISRDINIYDFFNPFEVFHWHFTLPLIVIISLVLAASLLLYRPFCQFVCPAGFLTWIFEHISLFAVQKNEIRCTNCRQCIKASPCRAIEAIVNSRQIVPDCFACGACIQSCPEDALTFSLK